MKNINFHRPKNKEEIMTLLRELTQKKEAFVFYAGGTDVSPGLKLQRNPSEHIVFLRELNGITEMKSIHQMNGAVSIGAMCTLEQVATHPIILAKLKCGATTAQKVASPQIRNKATIGGNVLVDNRCVFYNQSSLNQNVHGVCFKASGGLCHLVPSAKPGDETLCRARSVSDLVPVLMILNATLHVMGPKGARKIFMREFYLEDGISRNSLADDEFLTHLEIPVTLGDRISYQKLRIREAIDFPSVGVAVGEFEDTVSICVSGVDTHPHFWNYNKKDFSSLELLTEKAIAIATKNISILKQDFFPPNYRKKMIAVYIKRGMGLGK